MIELVRLASLVAQKLRDSMLVRRFAHDLDAFGGVNDVDLSYSQHGWTPQHGCVRPTAAASICLLLALIVSSRLVSVRVHGERRRHHACGQGPPEAKIRYIRGFSDPGDSFTGGPTYIFRAS